MTRTKTAPVSVRTEPEDQALHSRRVAIVAEDDLDCRLGMTLMLRDLGYTVIPVSNGEAAVKEFEQAGHVDLLVTGLAMPGMDGLELIRQTGLSGRRLPIVAVTGASNPDVLLHSAGCHGAKALLMKPFDRAQFVAAVNRATAT